MENNNLEMNFKRDVHEIDDVINFSHERGMKHRVYHHYTTLENCLKILQSNFFHLTCGNAASMNDHHEPTKGSAEVWERTYIGSFSYGRNENMAMWGLYGIPWSEAVRISIPGKAMNNWINGLTELYSVHITNCSIQRKLLQNINSNEINLTDVIYADGTVNSESCKLKHGGSSFTLGQRPGLQYINNNPQITGYLKNSAWEYEQEVRIRICLSQKTGCQHIAIPIPEAIIEEMTVMAGPYFEGDLKERIQYKLGQISASGFTKLVNYRTLCESCAHGHFVRKQA